MVEWKRILLEGDGRRPICVTLSQNEPIKANSKINVPIPYNGEITSFSVDIIDDYAEDVIVDIWKTNGAVPTIADSILITPIIINGFNFSTNLSNFLTTTINENDCFTFIVTTASNSHGFLITLGVTKD
jgi:hypothetical protein